MYAMTCTRPITFSVGMLSGFKSNLGKPHLDAVKRLMTYLKGIMDLSLLYDGYLAVIEGYSDAS